LNRTPARWRALLLAAPLAFAVLASPPGTVAWGAAAPVASGSADDGFLGQYASTYHFTLGKPTAIRVTPGGDAVLFLRSGPRSFVQDLYTFDTATGRERVLLTAADILRGAQEQLSAEERARRERMRQAGRGIVSYQLSEDGQRILIPLGGRVFVAERRSGAGRPPRVVELTRAGGETIDPQLSPDGTRAAWVRGGDIVVADVAGGAERRLTSGASDTLTHGLAEFVAQEEMDRFSGFWWSPDGRSIAYETANLSRVETLHIADPVHPEREPQSWRYPRAGTPNADVRLDIVPAAGGASVSVVWDHVRYPYLATVRWEKNAPLTLLVQNRRQTEEALLAVDAMTGRTMTLLIERDAAWLNLDQAMPMWLADGGAFLWTTERGGAWQLELRARDGRLLRTLTSPEFGLSHLVHLDAGGRTAWVQASPDPTQRFVWRVSLDGRGDPKPIAYEPGLNDAVLGTGESVYVQQLEGPRGDPVQTVRRGDGSVIGPLRSLAEAPRIETHPLFLEVGSGGPDGRRRFNAVIVTPRDFETTRKWPVIVHVYGGPLSQMVMRSRNRYLLDQWIANHGFVVVSVDGRGTPGRGRAWERAIRGNLIQIPLDDQVTAVQALGHAMPGLDLERVGIFGWSFGGYVSAMAAMRRPDVFRAAVAGAPVADFRDYDTHYTERYLDLPGLNPRGYDASSVLTWAEHLERPLLVIHGTADDNVYFMHSLKLCDALFRAGRDFEFLPLPGFTHMVPDPVVTARLYGRIMHFFERHLAPGGSTP
jgi:dipeptidyl-peptidase-4